MTFYKRGRILAFDEGRFNAVDELCACAKEKAVHVFAVVGASAAVWQYDRKLSADAARLIKTLATCGRVLRNVVYFL